MTKREARAADIHKRGTSCSYAVYMSFSDINPNGTGAPAPRSEGGICGAVLAARKVLKELGTDRAEEFDERFLREFPSLKCSDLLRSGHDCREFVVRAVGIAEELISSRA